MSLTAEQLVERSTGLGGSDAAAAVGVSRWKTPYALYLEKRGEHPEPFEGNDATLWGNLLEPAVRQQYAERTGRVVRLPTETLRHPRHRFMLCHPDGVTDDGRLYEGKATTVRDGWGDEGTDEVPDEYLLQVQHNMLVTGDAIGKRIEVADLAVLIADYGWHWRRYEIPADRELQEMLVEEEHAFWQRVERGDPPSMATPEDVRLRYGRASVTGTVKATEEVLDACYRLVAMKATAKNVADAIEEQELVIKRAFGDLDTLTYDGEVIATWRAQKGRTTLNQAGFERLVRAHVALREAHPEIAAKFLTVDGRDVAEGVVKIGNPFRVLRLKVKADGESAE